MKSNNAGEDLWPRVEAGNEKLKQDAQTRYADSMQPISALYVTQLEAILQQKYVS